MTERLGSGPGRERRVPGSQCVKRKRDVCSNTCAGYCLCGAVAGLFWGRLQRALVPPWQGRRGGGNMTGCVPSQCVQAETITCIGLLVSEGFTLIMVGRVWWLHSAGAENRSAPEEIRTLKGSSDSCCWS